MTDTNQPEYTSQGVVRGSIPLFAGHPSRDLIPNLAIQETLSSAWQSKDSARMFDYGDEQGDPDLISFLAKRFNQHNKHKITTDNIMITGGSTGGVTLLTNLLTQANDTILVDAPSYRDALHIFRDAKLDMQAIPIDEGGVIVEKMAERLEQLKAENRLPKFYYVVPTFQNPSGITLSQDRREAIIKLSQTYGFAIIEDEVYAEIRFVDDIPPSFYQLAGGENVFHLGTFSKTLSPGMRIGWLVADAEWIQTFITSGTLKMGGGANPFTAKLVANFCQSGQWEKHVLWLRGQYKARRDTMLDALQQHMPEIVTWTHPEGGYFIWVTLPDSVTVDALETVANENNVYFATGTGFYVNPDNGRHNLRLSFSFLTVDDMQTGIATLGRIIKDLD